MANPRKAASSGNEGSERLQERVEALFKRLERKRDTLLKQIENRQRGMTEAAERGLSQWEAVIRRLIPDFDIRRDPLPFERLAWLLCKHSGLQPESYGHFDMKHLMQWIDLTADGIEKEGTATSLTGTGAPQDELIDCSEAARRWQRSKSWWRTECKTGALQVRGRGHNNAYQFQAVDATALARKLAIALR